MERGAGCRQPIEGLMHKTLKRYFPIFVFPTLIAFVISFLIPFIMGVYLSFTRFTTVSNAEFVGLANYKELFLSSDNFLNALWFTIRFTVVSTLTVNILAFALALLLTKGIPGTNFFRTLFFISYYVFRGILQCFSSIFHSYRR